MRKIYIAVSVLICFSFIACLTLHASEDKDDEHVPNKEAIIHLQASDGSSIGVYAEKDIDGTESLSIQASPSLDTIYYSTKKAVTYVKKQRWGLFRIAGSYLAKGGKYAYKGGKFILNKTYSGGKFIVKKAWGLFRP